MGRGSRGATPRRRRGVRDSRRLRPLRPDAIEAVAAPDETVAVCEAVNTDALGVDAAVVELAAEEGTTIRDVGVEALPAYNLPDGPHVDEDGDPFHAEGQALVSR